MSVPLEVALKIHRPRYDYEGRKEFLISQTFREKNLPHVTVASDAFQTGGGNVCLAYPICGKDLVNWQNEWGRPFSISETKVMARQIFRFLAEFHKLGASHTDLKPDNLLYDPEQQKIAVIDFGNATRRPRKGMPVGTREYTPPEAILGTDLDQGIDIWALGCTFFEMLTDELLFHPHFAAEQKYIEFSDEDDDDSESGSESGSYGSSTGDEDGEDGEGDCLFSEGDLVAGKYRLKSELGSGHFASVFRAVVENQVELPPLTDSEEKKAKAKEKPALEESPQKPQSARENRRKNRRNFGVSDFYDLALNYEHLLLMQNLLGSFTPELTQSGLFHRIYCDANGFLKFDPPGKREPKSRHLMIKRLKKAGASDSDAKEAADFLLPMLALDPKHRATAAQCLGHPWLREI